MDTGKNFVKVTFGPGVGDVINLWERPQGKAIPANLGEHAVVGATQEGEGLLLAPIRDGEPQVAEAFEASRSKMSAYNE